MKKKNSNAPKNILMIIFLFGRIKNITEITKRANESEPDNNIPDKTIELFREANHFLENSERLASAMAAIDGVPVRCQRIGCDAMFTEQDNADGSCRYHDSVRNLLSPIILSQSSFLFVPGDAESFGMSPFFLRSWFF